ncbi:hypothetical protein DFH11DRAFT_1541241 [Phellopilus nigrolimitatus]|nr:hypothetical protein DFH11DRAFT_1541241 [Phellopilus nigrolimitatus]
MLLFAFQSSLALPIPWKAGIVPLYWTSHSGFGHFLPAPPSQKNVEDNTPIEATAFVASSAASQPTDEEPNENQVSTFRKETTLPFPCPSPAASGTKRPRSEPLDQGAKKRRGKTAVQHANVRRSKSLLRRRV